MNWSWLLGGLLLVLCQTGWGAEVRPQRMSGADLARMPLPMVKAYVRERITEQRQRAERGGEDHTPPVLTYVSIAPQTYAGGPVAIDVRAFDKGSGIMSISLWGGTRDRELSLFYQRLEAPRWSINETMHGWISMWATPGPVSLEYAYLQDLNGNFAEYDASALSALRGNLQTTVINPLGGDSVPPVPVLGQIETPRTNLSRLSPGTSEPRYVRATLRVQDSGNPQVAGPDVSYLWFCTLNESNCFGMRSDWPGAGMSSATLHFGWQLDARYHSPGVYYLKEIELHDNASMWKVYTSRRFPGGTDDMSAWFPDGDSIVVKR